MARVVDSMPTDSVAKYPWSEWLDGQVWELTAGEDFTVSPKDLRAMAYAKGQRLGLPVTTRLSKDRKRLYIQAVLNGRPTEG